MLLTSLRLQAFDMSPVDTKMVENSFVEMRKDFNATADDLHSMLILSRMLGIIANKPALDAESWDRATEMESERRKRVNLLAKK